MSGLLLHICCAPCGGGCVARLKDEEDTEPVLYYSNSNLCSEEEFDRRLDSVRLLARARHLRLEVDPYDHASWLGAVAGLEDEPERGARCDKCFAWSLARTAAMAEALDMDFATTLTVSPLKESRRVFAAGRPFPRFREIDFKKKDGYRRSCEIASQLGFYRQNFCGCEFSKRTSSAKTQEDTKKK